MSVTSVSPDTGANHVEFLHLLEYCTTAMLREKIKQFVENNNKNPFWVLYKDIFFPLLYTELAAYERNPCNIKLVIPVCSNITFCLIVFY